MRFAGSIRDGGRMYARNENRREVVTAMRSVRLQLIFLFIVDDIGREQLNRAVDAQTA